MDRSTKTAPDILPLSGSFLVRFVIEVCNSQGWGAKSFSIAFPGLVYLSGKVILGGGSRSLLGRVILGVAFYHLKDGGQSQRVQFSTIGLLSHSRHL